MDARKFSDKNQSKVISRFRVRLLIETPILVCTFNFSWVDFSIENYMAPNLVRERDIFCVPLHIVECL